MSADLAVKSLTETGINLVAIDFDVTHTMSRCMLLFIVVHSVL